jgi:hypothetical protein
MSLVASAGGSRSPELSRAALRGRITRGATSFFAAVGIFSVAGLAVSGLMPAPKTPAPAAPAPKSDWIDYGKPVQVYALQTPEFGKDVRLYEARRHREGGGRQDILSYGGVEIGQTPALRIALYRPGAEIAPLTTFHVDVARQAARAGLALTRSSVPDGLATRFGTVEVADIMLARDETPTPCLGFRLMVGEPDLRVAGYACGGAKPLDRPTLACALDRLELLSPGDDKELAKYFIAAEQARNKACATQRPPGAKPGWLEPGGKPPALRASPAQRAAPQR